MSHDIDVLTRWIQIFLVIAAVCTNAFPIVYAFSRWNSGRLGQLLMLQAISFALVLDFTVLFQFWTPGSILLQFWIETILFALIACSTAALTLMMWRLNHRKKD